MQNPTRTAHLDAIRRRLVTLWAESPPVGWLYLRGDHVDASPIIEIIRRSLPGAHTLTTTRYEASILHQSPRVAELEDIADRLLPILLPDGGREPGFADPDPITQLAAWATVQLMQEIEPMPWDVISETRVYTVDGVGQIWAGAPAIASDAGRELFVAGSQMNLADPNHPGRRRTDRTFAECAMSIEAGDITHCIGTGGNLYGLIAAAVDAAESATPVVSRPTGSDDGANLSPLRLERVDADILRVLKSSPNRVFKLSELDHCLIEGGGALPSRKTIGLRANVLAGQGLIHDFRADRGGIQISPAGIAAIQEERPQITR